MTQLPTHSVLATAPNPGAVAIIHVVGPATRQVISQLTGRQTWTPGRLYLSDFAGIDQGLAVLFDDQSAQITPHGGPRVGQKILAQLAQYGAPPAGDPVDAALLFPEAESDLEADMLWTLAQAHSPAAVDLLLAQPPLWQAWLAEDPQMRRALPDILGDSAVWERLLNPPTVVVAGLPNVGKSTLTNRLLGRSASLVADLPGTTRDWVGGLIEIHGLALHWIDTPGLRVSPDPLEQAAIAAAGQVLSQADVLIALRDPSAAWPEPDALPRVPDLWVLNKMDLLKNQPPGRQRLHDLAISSLTGQGLDLLEEKIAAALGWPDQPVAQLWAFSPRLRAACQSRAATEVERYARRRI
ncbi:MAG: 50S ribosome-binding GTPase [Phycisphaeraceae bacterium]|nr:50S ribosome-binding GTPase [Phycisphaeraceae bacterium]